jgi:hypothetical protein
MCGLVALVMAGCGGSNEPTATTPQPLRAAGVSLQQAMDSSARAIDGVRGTRDSLERLGASLEPGIAQTGDVIVLLTPKATSAGTETMLLSAAREQRSFLQFAADSTRTRSSRAANSAIERAREAGRRASTAYAAITQQTSELAGLLPASTTFNTGRLRDAVRNVNRRRSSNGPPPPPPPGPVIAAPPPPAATGSTCGDGISVNAATSCPFARNVASEYRSSGGSSVIEVFSPVTQRTYTMSCSGGVPTVCRGGNNAVVYIR